MKTILLVATWLIASLVAIAQVNREDVAPKPDVDLWSPSITVTPPSARDVAWMQIVTALNGPAGGAATPADALKTADLAKEFYAKYPTDENAVEARKIEAIFVIYAADGKDSPLQKRMLSAVQEFRSDRSVPAFQRAVVAGTYEFNMARSRINVPKDFEREHESVARGLMKEFPEQPQGYISLLTVALRSDDNTKARMLAQEVSEAEAAPPEARVSAQRFKTRLDLIGQSVDKVFGLMPLGPTAKPGWPANRPGAVYVWASSSPESVALGEKLAKMELGEANVVGVCLDSDPEPGAATAAARKLPGRLVYRTGELSDMSARLGADQLPLLYLIDASGMITDVRGLENLEEKLATLGLSTHSQ